jgi:serine/threonine protein kinase/tetratricopeptide (TPR) repeat protein
MDTPDDDDPLDDVADAIADGRPVDWAALEARLGSRADTELLQELKLLEALASVHRADHSRTPADADAPASLEPDALDSWGPFTDLRRLGNGSFGVVYRARDPRLERDVALKLLYRRRTEATQVSAAVAEGRILARIQHPNVITVHGADVIDGVVGIWMELLAGRTLETELQQRGPFGAPEAALIGIDLCRALAAVHHAGLVHRDVKAQNVMRAAGGRIVLMDFGAGLEAAAVDAVPVGTPIYMAPELLDGGPPSTSGDLYALGVLLFKLVTGQFPIDAVDGPALREAVAAGRRRRLRDLRPDVPLPFILAVERATAPSPVDRVGSAAELEQLLERTLISSTTPIAPVTLAGTAIAPSAPPVRRSRRRALLIGAAATGLAALLAAYEIVTDSGPAPSAIRSIAVLPFGNLTGQVDQEATADAMTQLLIGNLGQLQSLRVISQTSAMAYKGSRKSLAAIAQELRVDGIVEGAIGRSGDRLRVDVQLLRADEARIWGQTYQRPTADLFRVQGEIAAMIADAVKLSLTPEQRAALSQSPVQSRAQDAFLRGLHRLNDSRPESLRASLADLQDATRLDPTSARAFATLSQCYLRLGNREVMPQDEAYTEALKAATRAQQLDDTVAEAHTQLAEVKFYHEWNWTVARREYERALQLDPNNSHAMARYALFLSALRRSDDAIRYATLARDLDPLSPTVRFAPGMAFFYARRYDRAVTEFSHLAEVPPFALSENDRFGLGRALAHSGQIAAAIREINQAIKIGGRLSPYLTEIARLHAVSGNPGEARRMLQELEGKPSVAPANLAFVRIALGDIDQAFADLQRAVDRRSSVLLWCAVDPRLDPVRTDPRFQRLIAQVGIPQ